MKIHDVGTSKTSTEKAALLVEKGVGVECGDGSGRIEAEGQPVIPGAAINPGTRSVCRSVLAVSTRGHEAPVRLPSERARYQKRHVRAAPALATDAASPAQLDCRLSCQDQTPRLPCTLPGVAILACRELLAH